MEGRRWLFGMVSACVAAGVASGQVASSPPSLVHPDSRLTEVPAGLDDLFFMHVRPDGMWADDVVIPPGPQYRGCTNTSSHTDADFEGGEFVIQAGFAEQEVAAASYVLNPDQFPVRIDLMEMIFATYQATESTTTEWSLLVWDGPPGPSPAYVFSSDGVILPHIELPPGTNGINLQLSVDPNDPDQIILENARGTNTISFGIRIDKHNEQTQDPCVTAPPLRRNAFPTTDTGGLQSASGNWLRGVNCGPFGCPSNGGWASFAQLPSYCRPSGDWVMRMTWTSLNCTDDDGACCLGDGSCVETDPDGCAALGGAFQGNGTTCADTSCPIDTQACCFESTGGCLDLTPSDCLNAGGVPGGPGTQCSTFACFPEGAACFPDGTCMDGLTPDEAQALGGTYMGDGTTCADVTCPDPVGAACFPNGFCLVLTEADAIAAGATWAGPGTDCTDADGNGTADACESCDADVDGNGVVDTRDVIAFLNLWAAEDDRADFDDNGTIDTRDVIAFLNAWTAGC
jgi:hypothetical protein